MTELNREDQNCEQAEFLSVLTGKNNVMLDIETMGTGSDAAIIAIGAVKFNSTVTDRFYRIVNLQSSLDVGLKVDGGTILWWLKQSQAARREFLFAAEDIRHVLDAFTEWVGEDPVVWGNGATFDNVIMTNAYELCGLIRPWDYKSDMCYRTVMSMYPDVERIYGGISHRAVDDAENQAKTLISAIYKERGCPHFKKVIKCKKTK